MLRSGFNAKEIANTLEISLPTTYKRLARMCRVAGVVTVAQLVRWIWQHPECLEQGGASESGLHLQPCTCGGAGCTPESAAIDMGAIARRLRG